MQIKLKFVKESAFFMYGAEPDGTERVFRKSAYSYTVSRNSILLDVGDGKRWDSQVRAQKKPATVTPIPNPDDPRLKATAKLMRACLSCHNSFPAKSRFNYVCEGCKALQAWKTGNDYSIGA